MTCVRNIVSWLFLAILFAGPQPIEAASGQIASQDFLSRTWSKNDGLPDNSVMAVLETRDGYLWVGTLGGLVRFDGLRFEPVGIESGKPNNLLRVTSLCQDRKGTLWVGTQGSGLLLYENGSLRKFQQNERLLDQVVTSLAADREGNLWISTPSGLNRYDGRKVNRLTTADGLPNDSVSSVHVARSGTVWITTREGMCQYRNGTITRREFTPDSHGRRPEFIGVYEDQQGSLWAFGDTYLENMNEGGRFNYFRSGNTTALRIWSICEGRQGQLWIGTSGEGLGCFAKGRFLPVTLSENRMPSDVRAICEDREGNLWLGTYDSGLVCLQPRGVRLIDPTLGVPARTAANCLAVGPDGRIWAGLAHWGVASGTAVHFERAETGVESQNLASSVCITPDGGLWVGTLGVGLSCTRNGKTLHYTIADGLADDTVLALATDESGTLWVGTRCGAVNSIFKGRVTTFGKAAGLPGRPICAIAPSRNRGIWLGTESGELLVRDHNEFLRVQEASALLNSPIRALYEDTTGVLWIGTERSGLACISSGQCWVWDKETGLPDDQVVGIVRGDDGSLWLATGNGICRIPQSQVMKMLYGHPITQVKRFLGTEMANVAKVGVGWPRGIHAPDGRIWFATGAGLVTCDPEASEFSAPPPPVYIESITANERTYNPFKRTEESSSSKELPLKFPADLRQLDIQFTGISFAEPSKTTFRHKLEGLDSEWVDGGDERRVRYGRLPYGSYNFRVIAANSDGVWNETGATFSFVIPTPPWKSWWALVLYGLSAVGMVAGSVRLISYRRLSARLARSREQEAMQKERIRIAQNMHDEIGSKLTKISFLSERARREVREQEPVATKLDSIAGTSRDLLRSLDEIVWAVNPHNDTLEHLAAYLGQYADEYLQNTALECELHLPRELPAFPLSAEVRHNVFLAFEEALNNILKHAKATLVCIEMTAEPSCFKITVRDNGCGFDAQSALARAASTEPSRERRGNGLLNLQQRLAGTGGKCTISSEPGQGTTITFNIPLTGVRKNT